MKTLPKALYRADQVRELDRLAMARLNTPGIELMERAGTVAYHAMRRYWPRARRVAVFCGGGNNGGDGFVLARLACDDGLAVSVFMLGTAQRLKGDARIAFEKLQTNQVPVSAYQQQDFGQFDVLVDAILGTGLTGEVSGIWRTAIEQINHFARTGPVLALDIPSGLHADSGAILGAAVKADVTVTFIGVKQGLLTAEGPDCCGQLEFYDLDVDPIVYHNVLASAHSLNEADFAALRPSRSRAAHKRDFGHVLVVGGNQGMSGAARMAGEAALRCGAGVVTVATRASHAAYLAQCRPEIMSWGVEYGQALASLIRSATVITVGPGLGQDEWAQEMLSCVLDSGLPLVVDADALNLLAREPLRRDRWILTPHPGEAGRLLGVPSAHVQQDRFGALTQLQQRYGGIVVLKGCGSLIADGGAVPALCPLGNPGMASAGMGDVLAGAVAALVAQGLTLADAARMGVYCHALAGDRAAGKSPIGLLATDLLPHMRCWLNERRNTNAGHC